LPSSKLLGQLKRCPICKKPYYLCHACDRGHWYCSTFCAAKARKLSQKRASQRYRQTDAGRLAHSLAQKRYRRKKRLKQESEIYHSSAISPPSLDLLSSTDRSSEDEQSVPSTAIQSLMVCNICGRTIEMIWDFKRFPQRSVISRKGDVLFYDYSRDSS